MAEFVVRSLPNIDPSGLDFSTDQMREVGMLGIERPIETRLARGVGANDQQMAPLKERTRKLKLRRGRRPIRDMKLSGQMLAGLGVVEVAANFVRVAVEGRRNQLKAAINQARDLWMGLSPSDARTTDEVMQGLHRENIARMNRGAG